ncbi:MAG TPA: tetratricopeptide repeat protein [Terriglobia bacterium]|nr:tetratricopeptide repeat protein [Terriglobia bacterium]
MLTKGIRTSLALLLIGMTSLAPMAAAQRVAGPDNGTGGGAISGQIIVPVPGFWDYIEVILEYETGVPVYTHTDTTGNFAFSNLLPGRYYVVVDLVGFEKVRERYDVIPGDNLSPARIYLVPDGEKAAESDLRQKYSRKAVDEYEKGQGEVRKGDMAKAAQRLSSAVKESPTFFEAQLLLGTVYYKLKKMADAETAYRKALELDPLSTRAMMNLGQLYIENADASMARSAASGPNANAAQDAAATQKVFDAAHDLLAQAARLEPGSATAAFLLGVASYKSNRNDEAENSLKRALLLDQRMGQAQVMLANVYIRKQNWTGALDTLDAYLKAHGSAPDAKPIQQTRDKIAELVKGGAK